jgi:hypothetical protein
MSVNRRELNNMEEEYWKSKKESFRVKNLRLWSLNPRYSTKSQIDIKDIGFEDFEFDGEGYIIKDNYEENYKNYMIKLLSNLDSILMTRDLIESLSSGFIENLDEIIVVKPKTIISKIEDDDFNNLYLKDVYYVIEGNRRLLSIDILQNNHNSREILDKLIDNWSIEPCSEQNKKMVGLACEIKEICSDYDKNKVLASMLTCTEFEYDYYETKEGRRSLNRILNSKHFGNRKGKLNWPRGLILSKIFSLVKRKTHLEKTNLYKYIESIIGKKISSQDINAALFVNKCISLWNETNSNEQIDIGDTETGDVDQVVNNTIVNEDGEVIISTERSNTFYISALENARANIKIYNEDFVLTPLNKVLKFDFDYSKLLSKDQSYVTIYLGKKMLDLNSVNGILLAITEGVKTKEITTRSIQKNEITSTGKKINDILSFRKEIDSDSFLNLSVDQVSNMEHAILNENEDYREIVESIKNVIVSSEMISKIHVPDDNAFLKVLSYIWKIEYGRVNKLKNVTKLSDAPTMIFSTLARATDEFISQFISFFLAKDYMYLIQENHNYKPSNKAESLMKKFYDKIFWEGKSPMRNIFEKDKKTVSTAEVFENAKQEEKMSILQDIEKWFWIIIGIDDFYTNDEIEFKYFDNTNFETVCDKTLLKRGNNGSNYFINTFEIEDLNTLSEYLHQNNFFGKLPNDTKIDGIIEFLRLTKIDKIENRWRYLDWFNRFIHKPLSNVVAFLNNDDQIHKLNLILSIFVDIEQVIFKII